MQIPQEIVNLFFLYGIICFSATVLFAIYILSNYLKYKVFFHSIKDVEIAFLKKSLKQEEEKRKAIESENEEITKIIIGRLKWK